MGKPSLADTARVTLAGIRVFNGASALFAPHSLSRRLGVEESSGPMGYPFRMFGVRTILIGADLLSRDPAVRRHALRAAVLVHACDTVSAFTAGVTGGLPRRGATTATAISALNVLLALVASRHQT
jgi:hypothetical protein